MEHGNITVFDEIRAEGMEKGIEKGRVEEARALVARQGRQKFGKDPTKKQSAILASITEVTRLESLADRLLVVDSWAIC